MRATGMTPRIDPAHPLHRLFSGLVEQVFEADIGICDPHLVDYLSEVLVDFVHIDQIYSLRTVDGETIRDLSQFRAADLGPELSTEQRQRLVNKYIGDFTLFWSGVYPESLRPRHAGVDRLREFVLQGRRSYGIASELTRTDDRPPAAVLQSLSEQFEFCVHGLRLVRAGWEQLATLRTN
jgi:hypothetical protein